MRNNSAIKGSVTTLPFFMRIYHHSEQVTLYPALPAANRADVNRFATPRHGRWQNRVFSATSPLHAIPAARHKPDNAADQPIIKNLLADQPPPFRATMPPLGQNQNAVLSRLSIAIPARPFAGRHDQSRSATHQSHRGAIVRLLFAMTASRRYKARTSWPRN